MISEADYVELLEYNQRAEALLNKCAETLQAIEGKLPTRPDNLFHKDELHTVADALRFATAELFLIRSSLERLGKGESE